ncbi:5'-3' exonuclease [Mycoplasma leonicaptivi]|uniref:5'-3' exonuclease n=1 Tax=Mycoplasma leonicaptivi TaxID=36742 RepID=UPI0006886001|nr:5'-3' exonuclease H3TH domain-containing protein [Mycoplasma leonicaptivi]
MQYKNNIEKKPKTLLVDANFLMFQSFYATYRGDIDDVLRTKDNIPTNAISVFCSQLVKLLNEFTPDAIVFAFDSATKTKRHEVFQDYKGQRPKSPNELFIQFDYIKKLLTLLNLKYFEIPGDEADDIIATCAKILPGQKIIFSNDKDLLQLVNEDVYVVQKKPTGYFLNKLSIFYEHYEIWPNQIPDFKGLKGDPSDNLPGVKGIGDKTAIALLQQYQTFENIYNNIDEIQNNKKNWAKKLLEGYQEGLLCYKLAILNNDVQGISNNLNDFLISNITFEQGIPLIQKLELNVFSKALKTYLDNRKL